MKILLLTDIPPCKNYTAGLVLNQLCRFLPRGSIACYSVVDPAVGATMSPDLDWIPEQRDTKPRVLAWRVLELAWRVLPWKFGIAPAWARETYNAAFHVPRIARRAIAFGRAFGADTVWCVLQGQTMVRLAVRVSRGLDVPLRTLVWDPLEWWLTDKRVDRFSRRSILRQFDRALRSSECCAVASWAMAEHYADRYGNKNVPVISSRDKAWARPPAEALHPGDELIIGFAGQLYATAEWGNLLSTLEKAKWAVEGRRVRLRVLGRSAFLHASGATNIEYLGWHDQEDAIRLMSEADILYCPYWSDPAFELEARLSFPGKVVTYLAAGRPILFHGPDYASPARFLADHDAALQCHSLENARIYNCLARLVLDADLYRQLSHNGRRAFDAHFTLDSMRKNFAEFLDVDADFLVQSD